MKHKLCNILQHGKFSIKSPDLDATGLDKIAIAVLNNINLELILAKLFKRYLKDICFSKVQKVLTAQHVTTSAILTHQPPQCYQQILPVSNQDICRTIQQELSLSDDQYGFRSVMLTSDVLTAIIHRLSEALSTLYQKEDHIRYIKGL